MLFLPLVIVVPPRGRHFIIFFDIFTIMVKRKTMIMTKKLVAIFANETGGIPYLRKGNNFQKRDNPKFDFFPVVFLSLIF